MPKKVKRIAGDADAAECESAEIGKATDTPPYSLESLERSWGVDTKPKCEGSEGGPEVI